MKSDGSATVYMANQGRVAKRNGQAVLVLRDGSTQEFSSRGVLQFLTFNEYPFEAGDALGHRRADPLQSPRTATCTSCWRPTSSRAGSSAIA